jgi:DNA-directed RNA polymerase sigma subunit (sigma70/sigma32)
MSVKIKNARKKFYVDFGTKYETQKMFYEAVSTLPAREQKVLKMRYGLNDDCLLSSEEVGIFLNLTGGQRA